MASASSVADVTPTTWANQGLHLNATARASFFGLSGEGCQSTAGAPFGHGRRVTNLASLRSPFHALRACRRQRPLCARPCDTSANWRVWRDRA
eukprot:1933405-Pyramimonas_sp.AAC.1